MKGNHMHAHYFQHVPFEGLGSIEPWLQAEGYEISSTKFFQSRELPDLDSIDMLIVMGGPMSVNDEEIYSWIVSEKDVIREAVESGKPTLGICLGAQFIASAMGAAVYQNSEKEIGWLPIQGISSTDDSVFRFPPLTTVFHWHGETYDLPPGATLLAQSPGCENQAFQIGKSTIGLQFHLETTPELTRDIVANCRDELVPSKYIQTERDILSATSTMYEEINNLMGDILSFLLQKSVS